MSDIFEPNEAANDSEGQPEALMAEAAKRIAELETERDDFRDRWMRAEAETQNVRARGKREVDEARRTPFRNSPRTWWKPPKIFAAACPVFPPGRKASPTS